MSERREAGIPNDVDQQESIRELHDGLERVISVSADRVFREPVRVGDTVVIPAAAIMYGGGFGFGGDNQNNGGGGGAAAGTTDARSP